MNAYQELAKAEGLSDRQRSLFNILDRAFEAAKESGIQIQVFHAPVYVDEHAEGEHVYAPSIGAAVLWPRIGDYDCDAVIRKTGVILTRMEDVTAVLKATNELFVEPKLPTIWDSDGTDGPCLICPPPRE